MNREQASNGAKTGYSAAVGCLLAVVVLLGIGVAAFLFSPSDPDTQTPPIDPDNVAQLQAFADRSVPSVRQVEIVGDRLAVTFAPEFEAEPPEVRQSTVATIVDRWSELGGQPLVLEFRDFEGQEIGGVRDDGSVWVEPRGT